MYKFIFSFVMVPVLFIALATPVSAASNTNYYQFRTEQEKIAYLYGIIAQLQAQLNALQASRPAVVYPVTQYPSYTSSTYISSVYTDGVDEVDGDSVEVSGRVTFKRDSDVRTWFEYGPNTNLTYSTESTEISGDDNDTEDFDAIIPDLTDNRTYYYRAIVEDENGRFIEGSIKSFRFSGDEDNDNNDNDNDNEDWSLDIGDDTYDTGDSVRVEYTIPDNDEDDENWIGLYEAGDNDKDYVSFKYVDDTDGSVTFRINDEGDYEFRLFSNDSFNQEAESDEFEVQD